MKPQDILLALACIPLAWGCSKEEIGVFSTDDAGIYFQKVNSYIWGSTTEYYGDSLSISFASANSSIRDAVYSAEVRTMGKVAAYDRPFKVTVDEKESTAVEGVHFTADFDTLVIRAGESSARVRIRFNRTDDLLDRTVRLKICLEDNEHFTTYFDRYKNTNDYKAAGELINGSSFVFSVNEAYREPGYWSFFGEDFFGPWTPKKFITVNEVCGLTDYDWRYAGFAGTKIQYGRFDFFARSVQAYLQEQADAGTPVTDMEGEHMQLASDYLVDYSRYE